MIRALSVILLAVAFLVFMSGSSMAQAAKPEHPAKTMEEKKPEQPKAEEMKPEQMKPEEMKPEHPMPEGKKPEHPK